MIIVLQTLNQRPGPVMSMPGMHNKMPGMGMMTGQPGCPTMVVNQMGQMQNMPGNPMLAQMNQMNQGNLGQQMGPQPVQTQQMGGPQMAVPQMGPNQIQAMQVCTVIENIFLLIFIENFLLIIFKLIAKLFG